MAVAALVLGILAAVGSIVPLVNIFAIVLALIGFGLGLTALLMALLANRSGLALSIAGLVLSVGSVAMAVHVNGAFLGAVSKALAPEPEVVANADPAPPVEPAAVAPVPPDGAVDAEDLADRRVAPPPVSIVVEPVKPTEPEPAAAPEPEFVLAPGRASIEGIQVVVNKALNGQIPLVDKLVFGEPETTMSQEPYLAISISIVNLSESKKIDYEGYAGGVIGGAGGATLTDNFGNAYRRVGFGLGTHPVGQIESASIYPGTAQDDVIVFERPVPNAEYLVLECPGKTVGVDGVFRFRIPMNRVFPR
ncbi:MAG TPA: hypothetical protein VFT74_10125 [Isosphaeraceae bacterium]|nr:hypothetical protein [Isosphaeraceae bacterium]